MHRIIAGGTGFIGQHLVKHWLKNGVDITVLSRDKAKVERCFGTEVNALSWDECVQAETLDIFKSADIVVNLCGEDIGAKRWTNARKQVILNSRIDPSKKLVEMCLACGHEAPALFNASAIGTYGLQETSRLGLPPAYTEDEPIDFNLYPDFLAEVGREWEKTLRPLQDQKMRVIVMRFGVVIGAKGGVLNKMLLPFQMGLGPVIGNGQQPFTWIAIDDLIAAIDFLSIHPDMQGVVNLVAPLAVSNRVFSKTLAKTLQRPCWLRLPEGVVKLLFGQMGDECLLQGQHVQPKRLVAAGFTYYYPELALALQEYL